ncbi:MAG: hypothetical protein C4335_02015 [Armatimonadota bacterium]
MITGGAFDSLNTAFWDEPNARYLAYCRVWTKGARDILDGFVSVNAPYTGGEVLTRPLTLRGDRLQINYATSAAGSVKVELTDPQGNPIRGFTAEDCQELYGDEVEAEVKWKNGDIRNLPTETCACDSFCAMPTCMPSGARRPLNGSGLCRCRIGCTTTRCR